MPDVIVTPTPTPTPSPTAAAQTEVPVDVNPVASPQPIGSQAPEKPVALNERQQAIQRAFDRANERSHGVKPADLKFGTKITITGHPMKDGRPGALWVKAVRDDGKEFYPAGKPGGRGGEQ
jgi:hypothetical protein